MSAKTPIRAVKDGNGNITGFSELQASDFIAISNGGTGAVSAAGARTVRRVRVERHTRLWAL